MARVGDHERRSRRDDMLAERVGEWSSASGAPGLVEPDLAGEILAALVNKRHECDGHAEQSGGQSRQAVECLLGRCVEKSGGAKGVEARAVAQQFR